MEDKVQKLSEEYKELAEFYKERANELREEWSLRGAEHCITMSNAYQHFHDKLENLLGNGQ